MECPRLVIGDGHLGIWGALRNVYPETAEQRCWNHKILNVLDKLPKREHAQAKLVLCRVPYAKTRKGAEQLRDRFLAWCGERTHPTAAEAL
jgi:putative transposase